MDRREFVKLGAAGVAGVGAVTLLPAAPGSAALTTPPTTYPADYFIFTEDGKKAKGQNCKTGAVEFTGMDWVTICNSILATANGNVILVDRRVPPSAGTIGISKEGVSIVSDSNPHHGSPSPMCGRIHLDATVRWLKGIKLQGLAMRELDFAIGRGGIESSTFYDLQILPEGPGGDIEGSSFPAGGRRATGNTSRSTT